MSNKKVFLENTLESSGPYLGSLIFLRKLHLRLASYLLFLLHLSCESGFNFSLQSN